MYLAIKECASCNRPIASQRPIAAEYVVVVWCEYLGTQVSLPLYFHCISHRGRCNARGSARSALAESRLMEEQLQVILHDYVSPSRWRFLLREEAVEEKKRPKAPTARPPSEAQASLELERPPVSR